MTLHLAITAYSSATLAAIIAGLALLAATILRRRHWWWKLPLALTLIVGPYLGDTVRCRATTGNESWPAAVIPTSLLLTFLETDTHWPYGNVFDRLNHAPQRHAMWAWQLDQLAHWCARCIASGDRAMVKRGVQIAATLTGKDCDEAIDPLAQALMHSDPEIAALACNTLAGLGRRAARARVLIEAASANAPIADIRSRAGTILTSLSSQN
jgi:hypothetical protein